MFTSTGVFTHDHDLDAGFWDGHSYDCPTPAGDCNCELPALADDLDDEDEDAELWIDYGTYVSGR